MGRRPSRRRVVRIGFVLGVFGRQPQIPTELSVLCFQASELCLSPTEHGHDLVEPVVLSRHRVRQLGECGVQLGELTERAITLGAKPRVLRQDCSGIGGCHASSLRER